MIVRRLPKVLCITMVISMKVPGKMARSTLRKAEIATGKVLQKIDLDRQYFGEGMTIKDGKIYQLTWRKKVGFVYDLESPLNLKELLITVKVKKDGV